MTRAKWCSTARRVINVPGRVETVVRALGSLVAGLISVGVCPGTGCQLIMADVTSIPALPVLTSGPVNAVRLDTEARGAVMARGVARVARVKLSGRGDRLREEDGGGAGHTGELGPEGGPGGRQGGGGAGQALEVVEGGEERDLVTGAGGESRRVLDHHVLVGVSLPVWVRLQLSLGQVQLPLKKDLVVSLHPFR